MSRFVEPVPGVVCACHGWVRVTDHNQIVPDERERENQVDERPAPF